MGVMEKMRSSTSSILWILIFSFGILWVMADVDFFGGVTQGPQNMGVVNGEPISIQEYNQRVSFYVDQYNQNQGGDMTPETRAMLEQQAWDDLVASRLLQQKMDELGIAVTDRELLDMVTGDNPAPFIRQQFSDQQGNIDRVALQAAIDAPENSDIWISIEQQLRDNRRQQKMNNFIGAGLKISSLDVKNQYIRNNSFADISFVRFPYADVAADEITVSEQEMRDYLSDNSDQFQRSETYRFQYVQWSIEPTEADSANTIQDVENMRERLEQAEDDSLFFSRNLSSTPYNGAYIERDQIREAYSPVLDLEVGEVSEVMMVDGAPTIFKKIDERGNEIKFAVFSYAIEPDPVATVDRLAESADDFGFYATEEGFESEAETRELEIRSATATKGNPFIPGIGQSQQVLSTLEGMRVGDISDPIETSSQFIVLQLEERISEGTRPFSEVRSQIENIVRNNKRQSVMLSRVQEMNGSGTSLEDLAAMAEKEIQTAENIRMSSATIPGAGREPKVIGAIFAVDEGMVTEPIEGETAIFVVRVESKEMADSEQLSEDQRSQIRSQLEQQKISAFNQVFVEELKEDADITDNRSVLLR
jgi:peptidyl-prolyl cis-trans isomerase D